MADTPGPGTPTPAPQLLLAEELALLSWGRQGSLPEGRGATWASWALSAALLADLEVADHVSVTPARVTVVDDAHLDDELLDAALDVLRAHPTDAARAVFLVDREIPRVADRLGLRLGERGLATPLRRGTLVRWRVGWQADPGALDPLVEELHATVAGRLPLDHRRALLISGVAETGRAGTLVPEGMARADAMAAVAQATGRSVLTRVVRHLVQGDARSQGLLE